MYLSHGRPRAGVRSRTGRRDAEGLRGELTERPLDYFRRFCADTSLSGSAIGTRCGLELFGADHVVFGTDCPFDPDGGPMYVRETIRVIDALDISAAEREQIYHGNNRRLIRAG